MSSISIRPDRLRELRERRGLTQRELARLCGMGEAQISKYELAQIDPSGNYLKILADQLEVSVDYLMGRTDEPLLVVTENALTSDERKILRSFRKDGWAGVTRLVAEQLEK